MDLLWRERRAGHTAGLELARELQDAPLQVVREFLERGSSFRIGQFGQAHLATPAVHVIGQEVGRYRDSVDRNFNTDTALNRGESQAAAGYFLPTLGQDPFRSAFCEFDRL